MKEFNEFQTPLTESLIKYLPKEIVDEFWEYVNTVPFIQRLVSPDRKRAKDLPRDEEGKIIVDLSNPHILEDMDYFRETAIHYQKHKCFTKLRVNTHPQSEYMKWFKREIWRIWHGMVRASDGEWITGDMYFYLNYFPIIQTKIIKKGKARYGERMVDLPEVWEGVYWRFHYWEQAKRGGLYNDFEGNQHAVEIARRGSSKSYSVGSKVVKNFVLGIDEHTNTKVKSLIAAYNKEYLVKDGTLNKVIDGINFLASNTQFPSRKIKNSLSEMQWVAGWTDEDNLPKGSENEILGISISDDPDKIRGKRSNNVFYEEYAAFPKFLDTWQVALPNVQEGSIAFGQNIGIACVCADTKVWDGNNLINIQDVTNNILGYDGNNITNEGVVYKTPEVYKECVEIVLQGGKSIKCSVDHPLLCNYGSRMDKSKKATFKEANTIKRGDRLLMPITPHSFGNKRMWNPRLVGLLIGDGNYSASCCCPDLAINSESIYKYIDDNFDTNFKTLEECTDGSMYARVWFKGILSEIKNLGIYGQSKDTKTLPDNIYSYTKNDVCELLGGYFDADGNVQLEDTTIKVKLTCKSRNLIEQVHYLLLSLGIYSSIMQETKGGSILKSKVNNKEYNMPAYTCNVLYITNYSAIKKFRELIYFVDTEKQRRLELIDIVDMDRIQGYMTDIKYIKTINKGDYFIDKVFSEVYSTIVKDVIPIGVQRVYNLTTSTTHTYITNGILSHNTGGSEGSDFMGALEMIQHPRGYNVYALPNIYDKNSSGKRDTLFFFPGYVNVKGFYNKDGVSDVVGAMIDELKFRYNLKYNSSDPIQLSRRKAETAFTIQDAIMKTDSTIYPVADLNDQINWLDNNPTETQKLYVGKLILRDGEVEWKPDTEAKPINNFPHKDNKLKGAVVIKEHPIKGSDGKVPWGRYISGADTIDTDGAETLSLFSCYILDLWTDEIVAEYTGREELTDDSFEIYRLLLMYYNAEGNYENNKKGLFSHFSKFNSLHLLADTLEFLREKDPQRQRIGNATKGTPSSVPIKNRGRIMIRNFLLKPYDNIKIEVVDGVDTEVKTTERALNRIRFRALLQELATHNMDGNFDRHDALLMLMLIREDKLRLLGDDSWENRYERDKDYLGDDPFFNSNYGGEDNNKQFLETMKRLGISV